MGHPRTNDDYAAGGTRSELFVELSALRERAFELLEDLQSNRIPTSRDEVEMRDTMQAVANRLGELQRSVAFPRE